MQLAHKNILITGGAQGIGRLVALDLARNKAAHIWAVDINDSALSELSKESKKYGTEIQVIKGDVSKHDELEDCLHKVTEQGQTIDVWINNAGVAGIGKFNEVSRGEFDRVLNINLMAMINGTRIALRHMEDTAKGMIVNIASVAGYVPCPYMSAYVASKFGVVGFTRSLQTELAMNASPVKLLLIAPGFVETQMVRKGERFGFPNWLSFMLAKPETVARDIVYAMEKEILEYTPTMSGKMLRTMHKLFPNSTVKSSKLLLAKTFKDVLLNRYEG